MSNQTILVLGGGVAGSSIAYYLTEKGYDVTIIEQNSRVGGLARTCYYGGHPYEFGPHIWFWPGGKEDADQQHDRRSSRTTSCIYIDRRLFTYVEADRRKYRYPVHYEDVAAMPEREQIERELRANRDEQLKLIESQLPELGNCKFARLLHGGHRPDALPASSWPTTPGRCGTSPGDELETSMVWADRFQGEKGRAEDARTCSGYDPLKFDDHTLGKGDPVPGLSEARLERRVGRDGRARHGRPRPDLGIEDEHTQAVRADRRAASEYYFADYHTVFCSIDIDRLWGEDTLPYTGRMMIPLVIPGLARAFPDGAESLHYSSCEFQTRVTEMKVITRHDSPDTLILIEVPVLPGAGAVLSRRTRSTTRVENNLFAEKAYPQQSAQAFATYHAYVDRGRKIPNLRYVGRHAEFKYWGMAETVNSAYQKSLEFRARCDDAGRIMPSTTSHKREPLLTDARGVRAARHAAISI